MIWIFVAVVIVAVIVTAAIACFFMGFNYKESDGEVKVDTRTVEEAVGRNREDIALNKVYGISADRMTMDSMKVLESSKRDQSGDHASEPRMPSESEDNKVESRSKGEEEEGTTPDSPSRSVFRSAETTDNVKTGVSRGPASSVAGSQSGSTNAVLASSSSTGQVVLPTPTTLTGTSAGSTFQSSYATTSTRPNVARSVTHVPMCEDAGRTPPLCSPPRLMDEVMKPSQSAI
ncbi:unnamed protein product [Cylicocyclus nassatus]|uniref:Uncharacterized protein n=1 Tax=Cylicocyclus nassatus TaxID=53992 RepID=A0AA36GLB8_CYLNA|nr:unnamed protein product [Cylicocyclus nassatus]